MYIYEFRIKRIVLKIKYIHINFTCTQLFNKENERGEEKIKANQPVFLKTQNVEFEFFTSKHISAFVICSMHFWALNYKQEIHIYPKLHVAFQLDLLYVCFSYFNL